MKTNIKTLVLDTTDVVKGSQEKKLPELKISDLRPKSVESFKTSDFVVGISESGQTVVLKNRWGNNGVVVSHEDYEKFIKPNYENNKLGNPSEKKRFLGRFPNFKFWPFN